MTGGKPLKRIAAMMRGASSVLNQAIAGFAVGDSPTRRWTGGTPAISALHLKAKWGGKVG
jgi:hypothetical protein